MRTPPEKLNRLAQWGLGALLVLATVGVAAGWAVGGDGEVVGVPTVTVDLAGSEETREWGDFSPQVLSSGFEARDPSTTTSPSTTVAETTTVPPVAEEQPTETAPPPDPTTTAPTTTQPPTTTDPPTTTTTTAPTTTAPPTTTTTVPPTTTTTVPTTTTTTTTVPPTTTTTTVVQEQALYVSEFDGDADGIEDLLWRVRLDIDIDATADGPHAAAVTVAWSGAAEGQQTWTTNNGGRLRVDIGPFSGESVTFTIVDVGREGWVYRPDLDEDATTITVEAPDLDDDDDDD